VVCAAGDTASNGIGFYPGALAATDPSVLTATALTDAGTLQPYANYGLSVAVGVPSVIRDYGQPLDLGTSGASAAAAAWVATEASAHPYAGGSRAAYAAELVQSVEDAAVPELAIAGRVGHGELVQVPSVVPFEPLALAVPAGPLAQLHPVRHPRGGARWHSFR